jgi:hypothetical protein
VIIKHSEATVVNLSEDLAALRAFDFTVASVMPQNQTITTTTTSTQVLGTFDPASSKLVKILLLITHGTYHQGTELLIVHNGTTVSLVSYADVTTDTNLANFDAVIVGGVLELLVTPININTTFTLSVNYLG